MAGVITDMAEGVDIRTEGEGIIEVDGLWPGVIVIVAVGMVSALFWVVFML